jgi:hypothetical protein
MIVTVTLPQSLRNAPEHERIQRLGTLSLTDNKNMTIAARFGDLRPMVSNPNREGLAYG